MNGFCKSWVLLKTGRYSFVFRFCSNIFSRKSTSHASEIIFKILPQRIYLQVDIIHSMFGRSVWTFLQGFVFRQLDLNPGRLVSKRECYRGAESFPFSTNNFEYYFFSQICIFWFFLKYSDSFCFNEGHSYLNESGQDKDSYVLVRLLVSKLAGCLPKSKYFLWGRPKWTWHNLDSLNWMLYFQLSLNNL